MREIFIQTDADGKVNGWSENEFPQGLQSETQTPSIRIELSETHDFFNNFSVYRYINNELIKDDQLVADYEAMKNKPTPIESLQKAQTDLTFNLMMKGVL